MKPNTTSITPVSAKPVTEFWYGILPVALNHSYDHAGGWSGFSERACHPLYDGEHGLAWPPGDPVLYAASLQRFRSLPIKVVHGGHYGSFDRSPMLELVDEQLADLDQYLGH